MDYEKIAKITPVELAQYLTKNGWQQQHMDDLDLLVYRRIMTDETFEVIVYLNETIRDYPTRMNDVLKTLAVVEGRTPEEIMQQILFGSDEEWDRRCAYVERMLPAIVRTVEGLLVGIAELESEMVAPTTVAKLASMSRLVDQFIGHDEAVLMAAYAILKAAGSTE